MGLANKARTGDSGRKAPLARGANNGPISQASRARGGESPQALDPNAKRITSAQMPKNDQAQGHYPALRS